MRNNKGFAVSVMLYAMVLLIVTIFYIILAIVKNRYNTNEELVEKAYAFMRDNDSYAATGDKTSPMIFFSHNSQAFKIGSTNTITMYIYDDDNGGLESIKIDGIERINNTSVCIPISGTKGYKCTKEYNGTSNTLTVIATDKNNNQTIEVRNYSIPPSGGGPKCTTPKLYKTDGNGTAVLDELLCNDVKCDIARGGYAAYVFSCTSDNGIDSKIRANDIMVDGNIGVLKDFKVIDPIVEYSGSSTKKVTYRIIVRADAAGSATIKLKINGGQENTISDSAGNLSNPEDLRFPYLDSKILN